MRRAVAVGVALALGACDGCGTPEEPPPPLDTTAPVWPAGAQLRVTDTTPTSATLAWPDATDDVGVTGYAVEKEGSPFAEAASPLHLDGLVLGQHHRFAVFAVDAAGNRSAALEGEVGPAPAFLSPPNDSLSADFCAATQFLFVGPDAPQTGVAAGALPCSSIAVAQGRAVSDSGAGLPGLRVSVAMHPEFGATWTRADGRFELALAAGAWTLDFRAAAFIPIQRDVTARAADFATLDEVMVLRRDAQATAVSTAAGGFHQATPRADVGGQRQTSLLLPPGAQASLVFADGGVEASPTVTLRVTDVTAGAAGPRTMTASLPATSAFTFAADFSVDEAVAAGAVGVSFSAPVAYYVDNFLGEPVGTAIPQGAYDAATARWQPQPNAFVVRVLAGGQLDSDDDNQPDTHLALLPGEAEALAAHFPAGTVLWRGVTRHFSTIDANHCWACVGSCRPPALSDFAGDEEASCHQAGSDIDCHNQTVSEAAPVAGTPFRLLSHSHRGRQRPTRIRLSAFDAPDGGPSAKVLGVRFTLDIAGQHFTADVADAGAGAGQEFVWDGKDAWGRDVGGPVQATASAGYGYGGVYVGGRGGRSSSVILTLNPSESDFSAWPAGDAMQLGPTREMAYLMSSKKLRVGNWVGREGLGGLSLDILHGYSATTGTVFLGDGSFLSAQGYGATQRLAAGGGASRAEGTPWKQADLGTATSLRAGPKGELYYVEFGRRVRKLQADGTVVTVAGTNATGFGGDGGPATAAVFSGIESIALDADGTLFLADSGNARLRRVDAATGLVSTVVGTGVQGFSVDGTPVGQARLNAPRTVFLTRGGLLHFFTTAPDGYDVMRRVRGGAVETVAGGGATPALEATTPQAVTFRGFSRSVAEGLDGSLYVASYESSFVVRRLWPDGRVTVVAGGGPSRRLDESDARATCFSGLAGLAVDATGNLLVGERGGTGCAVRGAGLRVVTPDGALGTSAGFLSTPPNSPAPPYQPAPDDGLATGAGLYGVTDVAALPGGQVAYLHHGSADTVHVLETPARLGLDKRAVPSRDGLQLYVFDVSGRHLETRDAVTYRLVWRFGWNAAGTLDSISDGDGNTTAVQRDGGGRATGLRAPDGQVTQLAVDAQGRASAITDSEGRTTRLGYNAAGLLASWTDANGHASAFEYDADGRLLSDTNARGAKKTLARETRQSGYAVTFTTAEGKATRYEVSRPGATTRLGNTGPDGVDVTAAQAGAAMSVAWANGTTRTVMMGADPRWGLPISAPAAVSLDTPGGRAFRATGKRTVATAAADLLAVTQWTDTSTVNGRTWTSTFTAADKTWRTTTPLGRQASVTLDAAGRVAGVQVPGVLSVALARDARGRVSRVTQGPRSLEVTYGPNGAVATQTDALGKVTRLATDTAWWLVAATGPDGKSTGFSYDAVGNVTAVRPPGGHASTWAYSAVDEPVQYSWPGDGGTEAWAWDLDSKVAAVTHEDATSTSVQYDSAGRLARVVAPWATTDVTYDAATGQLASLTRGGEALRLSYDGFAVTQETSTGTVPGSVGWGYDNDFRVASVAVNGVAVALGYDNDGLLTSVGPEALARVPSTGQLASTTVGVVQTGWTYDAYGAVATMTATAGVTPLYAATLAYDDGGRPVAKQETVQGVTTAYGYAFDAADRLVGETRGGAQVRSWTYDDSGNRLTADGVASTYDGQDRQRSFGAATYGYDAFGNRTSRTDSGGTTAYSYDGEAHLLGAVLPTGTRLDFVVDARGRRVGKKRNGVLEKGWLYDGQLRIVAETDGTGAVVSRFLYGEFSTSPDVMLRGGATYRLVHDRLGSVRLVVDAGSGQVVQRLDYDAWGAVTADSSPGLQPFGYAGGLYDVDLRLVRFGARDYDAETGRWLSPEPLLVRPDFQLSMAQAGMQAPSYAYAANSPLRYTDPTGQGPVDTAVGWYAWWQLSQLPWTKVSTTVVNGQVVPVVENVWPFQAPGSTSGITLASSICTTGPAAPILAHEEQHIVQHQVIEALPGGLGEAYFPLHIAAQAYSYWATGSYSGANPLEAGPYSVPSRPWP